MVKRCQRYLEHLETLWYGGTHSAVLGEADEIKVEGVGQVTL